ncbi:hypothetical protein D3C71_1980430 [compost metagenome]
MDASHAVDLVERLALIAATAVEDEFLGREYFLAGPNADVGRNTQKDMAIPGQAISQQCANLV